MAESNSFVIRIWLRYRHDSMHPPSLFFFALQYFFHNAMNKRRKREWKSGQIARKNIYREQLPALFLLPIYWNILDSQTIEDTARDYRAAKIQRGRFVGNINSRRLEKWSTLKQEFFFSFFFLRYPFKIYASNEKETWLKLRGLVRSNFSQIDIYTQRHNFDGFPIYESSYREISARDKRESYVAIVGGIERRGIPRDPLPGYLWTGVRKLERVRSGEITGDTERKSLDFDDEMHRAHQRNSQRAEIFFLGNGYTKKRSRAVA